ncbi:MAG: hypothetical protein WDN06_14435 [Asticcacaulis sp.]
MKYLVLAALVLALPAHAADTKGFTAGDLTAAARAGRPDPAMADAREQLAHTEAMRAAFVLSPAARGNCCPPTKRAISAWRSAHLGRWATTPCNGSCAGASSSANSGDVTGLYNPIADVWLVLRWQRVGGAPRIADAVFLPGSALRDSTDRTPWTERPAAYADALAETCGVDAPCFFRH